LEYGSVLPVEVRGTKNRKLALSLDPANDGNKVHSISYKAKSYESDILTIHLTCKGIRNWQLNAT